MFTRVGFFEGKIRSGHEADFDRYVRETLLPIWRQTPHALRVEVMREVQADDAAHRFPMVLQIAYPDRKALDEALASPVRALGREATRGLYEFFAGRFFTPSTKLRNQVQRTPRLWPPAPKQSSRRRLNLTRRMTALCAQRTAGAGRGLRPRVGKHTLPSLRRAPSCSPEKRLRLQPNRQDVG